MTLTDDSFASSFLEAIPKYVIVNSAMRATYFHSRAVVRMNISTDKFLVGHKANRKARDLRRINASLTATDVYAERFTVAVVTEEAKRYAREIQRVIPRALPGYTCATAERK